MQGNFGAAVDESAPEECTSPSSAKAPSRCRRRSSPMKDYALRLGPGNRPTGKFTRQLAMVVGFFSCYAAPGWRPLDALTSIVVNLILLFELITSPRRHDDAAWHHQLLILTIGISINSNVLISNTSEAQVSSDQTGGRSRLQWRLAESSTPHRLADFRQPLQFGADYDSRVCAMTLTIGLLANVFTAVFVSRTMSNSSWAAAARQRERLTMRILTDVNINWLRWR